MQCWKVASRSDKRLFEAIAGCLKQSPHLLEFVFDREHPRLRMESSELLVRARELSSGDYLLIKLAIDLWTADSHFGINQLFDLDSAVFNDVIRSLVSLAKPNAL